MQEQSRGDIQFIEDNQQNFVEDFDDFVFRVSNTVRSGDITVNVENVKVPFIIDSGASINVIDSNMFKEIKCKNPSLRLQPAKTRVSAYANKVTPMKGIFFSSIARGSKRTVAKMFVTEESEAGCLLSRETSTELGVLRVTTDKESINCVGEHGGSVLREITQRYRGTVLVRLVR